MKFLLDDGNEHIGIHGAPDLRLDRVLAGAQELLDWQVLLDPMEEQFNLSAVFVQGCDGQSWQTGIVGQEDQVLPCLRVLETDAAQLLEIVPSNVEVIHCNHLIADHARAAIGLGRVHPSGIDAAFGADDEERPSLMPLVQAGKVQVAPSIT